LSVGVTVDEIAYVEKDIFLLKLLPDFESEFFPPIHTRNIFVSARLLDNEFLSWGNKYRLFGEYSGSIEEGIGSIKQGGYYRNIWRNKLNYPEERKIFDIDSDIFKDNISESPYDKSGIAGDVVMNTSEINALNCEGKFKNNTCLYGFYVGQGDMLLLITAAKNAYIIDTNIYKRDVLSDDIRRIKMILKYNEMDERRIKGLIITHKHLDHIRGVSQIIDSEAFDIEHFIMNLDYHHPTPAVEKLCLSASRIKKWINLNKPCQIIEGDTEICFKNPTKLTRFAPNINDSSIVMCVNHGRNYIYLTGDANSQILYDTMNGGNPYSNYDNVLKVSHHGSRTGINDNLIRMLHPSRAFISAGYSDKYKHPHDECIRILDRYTIIKAISKEEKNTVVYKCDGNNIMQCRI